VFHVHGLKNKIEFRQIITSWSCVLYWIKGNSSCR